MSSGFKSLEAYNIFQTMCTAEMITQTLSQHFMNMAKSEISQEKKTFLCSQYFDTSVFYFKYKQEVRKHSNINCKRHTNSSFELFKSVSYATLSIKKIASFV